MDEESLKRELEAARENEARLERQIKNLLAERMQMQLTVELLETAGFIAPGKLEEARDFARTFCPEQPGEGR